MKSQLKAVIFDLDGVIVDSELLWSQGRNIMFKPFGHNYSIEDKKMTMGGDYRSGIKMLIEKYKISLSVNEFVEKEEEVMDNLYQKNLKMMKGARELIEDSIQSKIKIAIATSSFRRRLSFVKEIVDLSAFNVEVTGDEIDNGKPAPDIFLKAADKLGIRPLNCVVLEDSRNGILGAKTAEMKTVAVIDSRFFSPDDYTGKYEPDLKVNSLKSLSVQNLEKLFK